MAVEEAKVADSTLSYEERVVASGRRLWEPGLSARALSQLIASDIGANADHVRTVLRRHDSSNPRSAVVPSAPPDTREEVVIAAARKLASANPALSARKASAMISVDEFGGSVPENTIRGIIRRHEQRKPDNRLFPVRGSKSSNNHMVQKASTVDDNVPSDDSVVLFSNVSDPDDIPNESSRQYYHYNAFPDSPESLEFVEKFTRLGKWKARFRLHDEHSIEDVLQTAWLIVFRKRNVFDYSRRFDNYFLTIVDTACRNHLRSLRQKGRDKHEFCSDKLCDDTDTTVNPFVPANLDAIDERDELDHLLGHVSEPNQETVKLLLDGQTPEELAERDGIGTSAVHGRKYRAIARMREVLAEGIAA